MHGTNDQHNYKQRKYVNKQYPILAHVHTIVPTHLWSFISAPKKGMLCYEYTVNLAITLHTQTLEYMHLRLMYLFNSSTYHATIVQCITLLLLVV